MEIPNLNPLRLEDFDLVFAQPYTHPQEPSLTFSVTESPNKIDERIKQKDIEAKINRKYLDKQLETITPLPRSPSAVENAFQSRRRSIEARIK